MDGRGLKNESLTESARVTGRTRFERHERVTYGLVYALIMYDLHRPCTTTGNVRCLHVKTIIAALRPCTTVLIYLILLSVVCHGYVYRCPVLFSSRFETKEKIKRAFDSKTVTIYFFDTAITGKNRFFLKINIAFKTLVFIS